MDIESVFMNVIPLGDGNELSTQLLEESITKLS